MSKHFSVKLQVASVMAHDENLESVVLTAVPLPAPEHDPESEDPAPLPPMTPPANFSLCILDREQFGKFKVGDMFIATLERC